MLGKYYSQLEEWLGKAPNEELLREHGHLVRTIDPAEYLAELLAELLNRARAMEYLIEDAAMEQGTSNHIFEAIQQTFLKDCEEVRARAFRAGFLSDSDSAFVTSAAIPSEQVDMINLTQLPVPERRCDTCGEKFQPKHFAWRWCGRCCDAPKARASKAKHGGKTNGPDLSVS